MTIDEELAMLDAQERAIREREAAAQTMQTAPSAQVQPSAQGGRPMTIDEALAELDRQEREIRASMAAQNAPIPAPQTAQTSAPAPQNGLYPWEQNPGGMAQAQTQTAQTPAPIPQTAPAPAQDGVLPPSKEQGSPAAAWLKGAWKGFTDVLFNRDAAKEAVANIRDDARNGGFAAKAGAALTDFGALPFKGASEAAGSLVRAAGNLTGSDALKSRADSIDQYIRDVFPADAWQTGKVDENGNPREQTMLERVAQTAKDVGNIGFKFGAAGLAGPVGVYSLLGAESVNRYNEVMDEYNAAKAAGQTDVSEGAARAAAVGASAVDLVANLVMMKSVAGGATKAITTDSFRKFIGAYAKQNMLNAARNAGIMGANAAVQDATANYVMNGDFDFLKTGKALADGIIDGVLFEAVSKAKHVPIEWSASKARMRRVQDAADAARKLGDAAVEIESERDISEDNRRTDIARSALEGLGMANFVSQSPDVAIDMVAARRRGENVDLGVLDRIPQELRPAFKEQGDLNAFADRLMEHQLESQQKMRDNAIAAKNERRANAQKTAMDNADAAAREAAYAEREQGIGDALAEAEAQMEANKGRGRKDEQRFHAKTENEREKFNARADELDADRANAQDAAIALEAENDAAEAAAREGDATSRFREAHGIKPYAEWLNGRTDTKVTRWTYNKLFEKAVRKAVAEGDPLGNRVRAEMERNAVHGELGLDFAASDKPTPQNAEKRPVDASAPKTENVQGEVRGERGGSETKPKTWGVEVPKDKRESDAWADETDVDNSGIEGQTAQRDALFSKAKNRAPASDANPDYPVGTVVERDDGTRYIREEGEVTDYATGKSFPKWREVDGAKRAADQEHVFSSTRGGETKVVQAAEDAVSAPQTAQSAGDAQKRGGEPSAVERLRAWMREHARKELLERNKKEPTEAEIDAKLNAEREVIRQKIKNNKLLPKAKLTRDENGKLKLTWEHPEEQNPKPPAQPEKVGADRFANATPDETGADAQTAQRDALFAKAKANRAPAPAEPAPTAPAKSAFSRMMDALRNRDAEGGRAAEGEFRAEMESGRFPTDAEFDAATEGLSGAAKEKLRGVVQWYRDNAKGATAAEEPKKVGLDWIRGAEDSTGAEEQMARMREVFEEARAKRAEETKSPEPAPAPAAPAPTAADPRESAYQTWLASQKSKSGKPKKDSKAMRMQYEKYVKEGKIDAETGKTPSSSEVIAKDAQNNGTLSQKIRAAQDEIRSLESQMDDLLRHRDDNESREDKAYFDEREDAINSRIAEIKAEIEAMRKPSVPFQPFTGKANPKKAAGVVGEFVYKQNDKTPKRTTAKVNHDKKNGVVVATDGRILIATKHGFNPNGEDDSAFPNWTRVVPNEKDTPLSVTVNPTELAKTCKNIIRLAKATGTDFGDEYSIPNIALRFGNHVKLFNAEYMLKLAKAMEANGIAELKTADAAGNPAVARNADTVIAVMPFRGGFENVISPIGRGGHSLIVNGHNGRIISAPERTDASLASSHNRSTIEKRTAAEDEIEELTMRRQEACDFLGIKSKKKGGVSANGNAADPAAPTDAGFRAWLGDIELAPEQEAQSRALFEMMVKAGKVDGATGENIVAAAKPMESPKDETRNAPAPAKETAPAAKEQVPEAKPAPAPKPAAAPRAAADLRSMRRGDQVLVDGLADNQKAAFLKDNGDGTAQVQVRTTDKANPYASPRAETRTVKAEDIRGTGIGKRFRKDGEPATVADAEGATPEMVDRLAERMRKFIPGVKVDVGELSDGAKASGASAEYDRGTNTARLRPDATLEDAFHELGGHGVWQWAEQHCPELLRRAVDYAKGAPKELRERIFRDYGEFDGKALVEELFSHRVESEGVKAFMRLERGEGAESGAERKWAVNLANAVRAVFQSAAKRNGVDLEKLRGKGTEEFVRGVLDQMVAGRDLNEWTAYGRDAKWFGKDVGVRGTRGGDSAIISEGVADDGRRYRVVDDPEVIAEFDNDDGTISLFRAVKIGMDGSVRPPQSSQDKAVGEKDYKDRPAEGYIQSNGRITLNKDGTGGAPVHVADERPDLAFPKHGSKGKGELIRFDNDDLKKGNCTPEMVGQLKYYFDLKKGVAIDPRTGKKIKTSDLDGVLYDPYYHTSDTPFNDQFSSAWSRPDWGVIEVKILKRDLESGYRAEKAGLTTGRHEWNGGSVDASLPKDLKRNVYLTQNVQLVRRVPEAEAAKFVDAKWASVKDRMVLDSARMTPQMREEMARLGWRITDTDSYKAWADVRKVMTDAVKSLNLAVFSRNEAMEKLERAKKSGTAKEIFMAQKALDIKVKKVDEKQKAVDDAERSVIEKTKEYPTDEVRSSSGEMRFRIPSAPAVTPEEDAAYMDAVKRKDYSTMREMVRSRAAEFSKNDKSLWHGSPKRFTTFEKGDVGFHVGTLDQARRRLSDIAADKRNVMNVAVRIENPLRMEDGGNFYPTDVASRLANKAEYRKEFGGPFSKEQREELSRIAKLDDGIKYDSKVGEELRKFLKGLGYDGIVYENKYERNEDGSRKDSYIAFDAEQVKSLDPVTFDDAGNPIPLSERFRADREGADAWKNSDIRFRRPKYDEETEDGRRYNEKYADARIAQTGRGDLGGVGDAVEKAYSAVRGAPGEAGDVLLRNARENGFYRGMVEEGEKRYRRELFGDGEAEKRGMETIHVYREGKDVIKYLRPEATVGADLEKVRRHNALFGDRTPYSLEGVSELPSGEASMVLRQPYIDFVKGGGDEARRQLAEDLRRRFGKVEVLDGGREMRAGEWMIDDLKDDNIGIDAKTGRYAVIDALIHNAKDFPDGKFPKAEGAEGERGKATVIGPRNDGEAVGRATGEDLMRMADRRDAEGSVYGDSDIRYRRADDSDLGYHYGDFGKGRDTVRGNMGGRSTGHFGTGTYFFGDKQKNNYGGRPEHAVDFSKYNMARPKNADDADALHGYLKRLNDHHGFGTPMSAEEIKNGSSRIENLWEKEDIGAKDIEQAISEARRISEKGAAVALARTMSNGRADYAIANRIARMSPAEVVKMIRDRDMADGEDFSDVAIKFGTHFGTEANSDYDNPNIRAGLSLDKGQVENIARILGKSPDEVRAAANDIIVNGVDTPEDGDSASTVFMKRLGFDGVDVRGIKEFDNARYGSVLYDITDNSVRYRRAGTPVPAGIPARKRYMDRDLSKAELAKESYMRNFADRYHPVKTMMVEAKMADGMSKKDADNWAVNDAASPYNAKRRQSGFAEHDLTGVRAIRDNAVDIVDKELKRAGLDSKDFDTWAWAAHAKDRNRQKLADHGIADGAGISDADADAILNGTAKVTAFGKERVYNATQRAALEKARKAVVHELNGKYGIEYLRKAGLIDAEQAQRLTSTYGKDYVCLADDMGEDGVDYNRPASVANPLRKASGRTSAMEDSPIVQTILGAMQNVVNAKKNMAAANLADFVENHPEMGVVRAMTPVDTLKPNEVTFRRNVIDKKTGREVNKRFVIELYGKRGIEMAQSFTDAKVVRGPQWMQGLTRAWAAFATQLSPTFTVRNYLKDTMEVTQDILGTQGVGAAAKFLGDQVRSNPLHNREFRGLVREFKTTGTIDLAKHPNSQTAREFKEFIESGSLIGGLGREGYAENEKMLKDAAKGFDGAKGAMRKAAALVRGYTDLVGAMNENIELLTRFNSYRAHRAKGESVSEAAINSREGSTDFGMYGNNRWMNSVWMFSNSILGGTMRSMKTLAFGKNGRRLAIALIAAGFLEEAANSLLNDDEDAEKKGDATEKDVMEYDRENSFRLRVGGKTLKVPIHFSPFALLKYAGNQAFLASSGRISAEQAGKNVLGAVAKVGSHFSGTGEHGIGKGEPSLIASLTPTAIAQPMVQIAMNQDYKGDPIHKEHSLGAAKHTPDWVYAKKGTNPLWTEISRALNKMPLSGGSDLVKGRMSIPPEDIAYFAKQVFKNFGTDVVNAALETPMAAYKTATTGENAFTTKNIPFVRDVVKDSTDVAQRYYEVADAHAREHNAWNLAKGKDKREYLRGHPTAGYNLAKIENSIKRLQALARGEVLGKDGKVVSRRELTTAQKEAYEKRARAQMANYIRIVEGRKR